MTVRLLNSLRSADEIIADLNQLTERSSQAPREVLQVARLDVSSMISGYRLLNQIHRCLMTCACGYPPSMVRKKSAERDGGFSRPRLRIAALDDVEMVNIFMFQRVPGQELWYPDLRS